MKKGTIALACFLAACSNGDGRDHHELEPLVGRSYIGATSTGDPLALDIEDRPESSMRLRGTLRTFQPAPGGGAFIDEYEAVLYRDDRFMDVVVAEFVFQHGTGWCWLHIQEGGALLAPGLEWVSLPFVPEPPGSLRMASYFATQFIPPQ